MSTRNVTLKLTTQKDLIVRESSARTFGELKAELKDIKWTGMRVVERTTKNTLQMDDAILPAVDFVLFLVPEKVKSGANGSKMDIDTLSYNELRSQISVLNKMKDAKISMDGKVEDLRKGLRQYFKGTETPKELQAAELCDNDECNDTIDTIEACRVEINQAIDKIVGAAKAAFSSTSGPIDNTVYIFKTSVDDLENEVNSIKSSLSL